MEPRIQNMEDLMCHGNTRGRKDMVAILEAGLQASDPYRNTRRLIRLGDGRLIVGCREYEPSGNPESGDAVYDLSGIDRIYVFGAGKGIQRVAKAVEDALWGRGLPGGTSSTRKAIPLFWTG